MKRLILLTCALALVTMTVFPVRPAFAGCEHGEEVTTTYYQGCPYCERDSRGWWICEDVYPTVVGQSYLACDGSYSTWGDTTNYECYTQESHICSNWICDN